VQQLRGSFPGQDALQVPHDQLCHIGVAPVVGVRVIGLHSNQSNNREQQV
jgi:hypothetical protein